MILPFFSWSVAENICFLWVFFWICLFISDVLDCFLSGSLQCNLLYLQFVKVEGVKFETSFMSERTSLFLSSIGLLGEYCPTSRKKYRHHSESISCMHLGPFQGYYNSSQGCRFMWPFSTARNLSGIKQRSFVVRENTAAILSFW